MSAVQLMEEAAEEAGLVYVSDRIPGITRQREGEGFAYFDPSGGRIRDEAELERIRALAIPPAYERVWICPLPNGHLQATGRDARGRKQYRYHPDFRQVREEEKFARLSDFALAMPKIRAKIDRDLRLADLPREKVLAAVVELLEKSFIRVGNEEYRRTNHSFGLTTLQSRHVRVEGPEIELRFTGKSRIKHQISLKEPRLARVIRRIQELPGQELFQYLDECGERHSLSSHDVNAYLHEATGESFTAKDFRTWAGTVLAAVDLANADAPKTKGEAKARISEAMRAVSKQLGNTPAVCRKCYVHPAVVSAYRSGRLQGLMAESSDPEEALLNVLNDPDLSRLTCGV